MEKLTINRKANTNDVLGILPFLDPKTLKSLVVGETADVVGNQEEEVEDEVDGKKLKILKTFKKLEHLQMFDAPNLPLETWWNVPSTHMKLQHVKLEDLKWLMEVSGAFS